MRILAFTDFHGNPDAYQRAGKLIQTGNWTCVIVAGDIVNHDPEAAKQRLTELASAGVPLLFVPGNMDNPALGDWSGTNSVHALHGRCTTIAGDNYAGLGGAPLGAGVTPFEIPDAQAEQLLNGSMADFKKGPLVLVSHCPPKDTKIDLVPGGDHIGSSVVRRFVEKFKPAVVISGHVHEARGLDSIGETQLVNTGPAKTGNCAEITLENKASVKLARF